MRLMARTIIGTLAALAMLTSSAAAYEAEPPPDELEPGNPNLPSRELTEEFLPYGVPPHDPVAPEDHVRADDDDPTAEEWWSKHPLDGPLSEYESYARTLFSFELSLAPSEFAADPDAAFEGVQLVGARLTTTELKYVKLKAELQDRVQKIVPAVLDDPGYGGFEIDQSRSPESVGLTVYVTEASSADRVLQEFRSVGADVTVSERSVTSSFSELRRASEQLRTQPTPSTPRASSRAPASTSPTTT